MLNFLEHFAKQRNCRRDEVIAEALQMLREEWEMEQGYEADKHENAEFAEVAIKLFSEVGNGTAQTR
ncbi:MAG: hypothetical protein AAB354_08505 [candidate division KSB1 bacterium]